MFKIIKYGRFGNNIIQLTNAILLARKMGITKIEHKFTFLSDRIIHLDIENEPRFRETNDVIYNKKVFSETEILPEGPFLQGLEAKFLHVDCLATKNEVCELLDKYVKPLLIFDKTTGFEEYYEDAIFIHIRSGDLFYPTRKLHPDYTQPPLDFYTKILDKENRTPIFFVEDTGNPVVNELKKLYPTSHFSSRSVPFLIGVFIHAHYVVSGNGTFINSILAFNKVLKKNYDYTSAIYPGYIDKWQNTAAQRELMISYRGTQLIC